MASANPAIDALVSELAETKARLHAAEEVAFAADSLLMARVSHSALAVENLRVKLRNWNASRQPSGIVYPISGD